MRDKPPRPHRTPQEKKKLSYERARANVYGENDKASRKAIPRFKAQSHRRKRRAAQVLIDRLAQADDGASLDAALSDVNLRPHKKVKTPDMPLGLALDERAFKRRAGADRMPTRNRRKSVVAAIERGSASEGWQRIPVESTVDK